MSAILPPPVKRPLWKSVALWALLAIFAGLFLREVGFLFQHWNSRR